MNWILWAIVGVVMIVAGIVALFNPFAATLTAEQLMGWVFLIAGLVQVFTVFRAEGLMSRIWAILMAGVLLLLGATLLFNPLQGVLALTLVAAISFLVSGVAKTIFSFQTRGTQFFVPLLIAGLVSVALGLMVLFNFPASAAVLLGILLAVELISSGATVLVCAFILKRFKRLTNIQGETA